MEVRALAQQPRLARLVPRDLHDGAPRRGLPPWARIPPEFSHDAGASDHPVAPDHGLVGRGEATLVAAHGLLAGHLDDPSADHDNPDPHDHHPCFTHDDHRDPMRMIGYLKFKLIIMIGSPITIIASDLVVKAICLLH